MAGCEHVQGPCKTPWTGGPPRHARPRSSHGGRGGRGRGAWQIRSKYQEKGVGVGDEAGMTCSGCIHFAPITWDGQPSGYGACARDGECVLAENPACDGAVRDEGEDA